MHNVPRVYKTADRLANLAMDLRRSIPGAPINEQAFNASELSAMNRLPEVLGTQIVEDGGFFRGIYIPHQHRCGRPPQMV